ncbi:alpha/beta hydrolase [Sodaliphilus sp.]|uniref:alpha/beta hydrolase n=1 Tax=Sodaliphilus sp. TaxID=2815818 RepID=UPI00388F0F1B
MNLKHTLILIFVTIACSTGSAGTIDEVFRHDEITVDLWPDGFPNSNGIDYNDPSIDRSRHLNPQMHVYTVKDERPTKAVILCPGGAYGGLAITHEGYLWRPFFEREKVATIVLAYRLPCDHHDVPASDVYQAMRLVKKHAAEWNIDPNQIGIMGFSAGGHLASTVATHAPADVRPAFQILFYPVISMKDGLTHWWSRRNLLGEKQPQELLTLYSNELQVNKDTPRAYIIHADDDGDVPVLNSVLYYEALQRNRVPSVLYVVPSGGHGFGIKGNFKYHELMLNTLSDWLHTF